MTRHHKTDPACQFHRPPRTRWGDRRSRGRPCSACEPTGAPATEPFVDLGYISTPGIVERPGWSLREVASVRTFAHRQPPVSLSFVPASIDESVLEELAGPHPAPPRFDLLVEEGMLPRLYRNVVVEEVGPGIFSVTPGEVEIYLGEAGWQPW